MTILQHRRRWGIALLLFAILLGWILWGFIYTQSFAKNNLPNMIEHRRLISAQNAQSMGEGGTEGAGISFYDLSVYENVLQYDNIAGYREVDLPVDFVEDAKVVLCNESVMDVYEFDMITGSTFTKEMIQQNLPYAIISDELALERFLTYSAVGQKIVIDGCEYAVIGVYDSHKGFWNDITTDGLQRIFIPYTSYADQDMIPLDAIAYQANDETSTFYYKFESIASGKYQYYRKYDFTEYGPVSTQYFSMFLMIVLLIPCVVLAILAYRSVRKDIRFFIGQKEEGYFLEMLRKDVKRIIFAVLKPVLCIVGILLLLLCNPYHPQVPVDFIPPEKIFDLSFYQDTFLSRSIVDNTQYTMGDNHWYRLFQNTSCTGIFFLIISILFLVFFLFALIQYIKQWKLFLTDKK